MSNKTPLGQPVAYSADYDPKLLCPIPRSDNRDTLPLSPPPFHGYDVWRMYEVSWLQPGGCPRMAVGQLTVPADSNMLIESKSMKLYFNSFNQTVFESQEALAACIQTDCSACCEAEAKWHWLENEALRPQTLHGVDLDALDVAIDCYSPAPEFLRTQDAIVSESLHTHAFKSNCLVTGQPDWASVQIDYQGPAIDHEGLIAYLHSYRDHRGFHEHCVEQIWCDLWQRCAPTVLTVAAYFTRRGGIDINPVRSSESHPVWSGIRLGRQ